MLCNSESRVENELSAENLPWRERVGRLRNWYWRGWQTRYTFVAPQISAQASDPAAPPLILLHGFGASIGHWRHNLVPLAQTQPVYALDLVGFGASAKPATAYNVQLWVAQLYDFWRALIRQPVVLVGNSIGSLVCLAAAAEHPEMVAGITLLSLPDTSIRDEMIPRGLRPLVSNIERLFTAPLLLQTLFYLVRRPNVVRSWASIAYANPAAVSDELVEILTLPARSPGAARAFAALIRAMTRSNFGPAVKSVLPGLGVPVLLLWGQEDRMIPPLLGRQFAAYNPRVTLVELEAAGHCPHDEVPERVNREILEWLATLRRETDYCPLVIAR